MDAASNPAPTPRPRTTVCPYCGHINAGTSACERCRGLFEPLSRQASQNSMGPWFIRDEANPFLPGCSLQTLQMLIRRGKVGRDTIIRGPSTRQFWAFARNAPGIAHLLGECHACHARATPDDRQCGSCGASFAALDDRERLGLSDVRLLPGHAAPERIAAASAEQHQSPAVLPPETSNGAASTIPSFQEPDLDAQALIAANQRRKRGTRRATVAVVILIVAFAAVGAAATYIAILRDRETKATTPSTPTPISAVAPPARPMAGVSAPVGTAPDTASSDSGALADLVRDLSSSDTDVVREALRQSEDPRFKADSRTRAATHSAQAYLSTRLLGRRL